MDLPGVDPAAVRVLVKGDSVLDRRRKGGRAAARGESSFHLVERGFGRFARVPCGCDAARLRRVPRASADARATASSRSCVLPEASPSARGQRASAVPVSHRRSAVA